MLRVRLHGESKQRLQENNKHHMNMAKPPPTNDIMDDPDIVKRGIYLAVIPIYLERLLTKLSIYNSD